MANLIQISTISDERGSLCVIEDQLGFSIKRVFYIFNTPHNTVRGGHAHKKTKMALICLGGSCDIHIHSSESEKILHLDSPTKCLLLEPSDWHTMENFSSDATLLVLASEKYDPDDYIYERQ
jgi:dTDP-4-dehydrorhamnose 3,5-epimerase-like enzyme